MKTIHIVRGETGEYSDRSDWVVRAFSDKQKAEKFIKDLEHAYATFPKIGFGYQRPNTVMKELREAMIKLDPQFDEDYTGTDWYLEECQLD